MTSPIGKKGRQGKAGVTLIELALVALLISVIAGLSIPLFKRTFSDLILKDSTFNISKSINYGQEKAIIERKNFKIHFDFQNRSYQLLEMDTAATPHTYKRMEGRVGKVYTLPQELSFKGDKSEVIFYPDGHCDEVSIDVFDARGEGYKLIVKGFGSGVTIEKI